MATEALLSRFFGQSKALDKARIRETVMAEEAWKVGFPLEADRNEGITRIQTAAMHEGYQGGDDNAFVLLEEIDEQGATTFLEGATVDTLRLTQSALGAFSVAINMTGAVITATELTLRGYKGENMNFTDAMGRIIQGEAFPDTFVNKAVSAVTTLAIAVSGVAPLTAGHTITSDNQRTPDNSAHIQTPVGLPVVAAALFAGVNIVGDLLKPKPPVPDDGVWQTPTPTKPITETVKAQSTTISTPTAPKPEATATNIVVANKGENNMAIALTGIRDNSGGQETVVNNSVTLKNGQIDTGSNTVNGVKVTAIYVDGPSGKDISYDHGQYQVAVNPLELQLDGVNYKYNESKSSSGAVVYSLNGRDKIMYTIQAEKPGLKLAIAQVILSNGLPAYRWIWLDAKNRVVEVDSHSIIDDLSPNSKVKMTQDGTITVDGVVKVRFLQEQVANPTAAPVNLEKLPFPEGFKSFGISGGITIENQGRILARGGQFRAIALGVEKTIAEEFVYFQIKTLEGSTKVIKVKVGGADGSIKSNIGVMGKDNKWNNVDFGGMSSVVKRGDVVEITLLTSANVSASELCARASQPSKCETQTKFEYNSLSDASTFLNSKGKMVDGLDLVADSLAIR